MYKCEQCNKEFEKHYSLAAHVSHHNGNHNILKRVKIKKKCACCEKEFNVIRTINRQTGEQNIYKKEKKYCSLHCSAIKNNIKKERFMCLICGKETYHTSKCCSRVCRNQYNRIVKLQQAIKQNSFINITTKPGTVRILLLEHYGHVCSLCGIEKWKDELVPLVMDHIDGNSDNWNFDNLRLICRNCDGLLPTFAGKNVGKNNHCTKRMMAQKDAIRKGVFKHRKVS